MNNADKRILRLIELLRFENKIKSIKDFCSEVNMFEQTITKIKKGTGHFTVNQIEIICKTYNVNSNWIFGTEKNVYRNAGSIEISVD